MGMTCATRESKRSLRYRRDPSVSLAAGQDGVLAEQIQGRPRGKEEDLRRNQVHAK